MAKMIPDVDHSAIRNKAEGKVYKALREQLPDDWVVRHHYPGCWMQGVCLRDCEADFIVIAPGRGLLFLEVKGSEGFDCVDGVWHRLKPGDVREVTDNPFDQVVATKHKIVERLSLRLGYNNGKAGFPGIYGHAVVYPNGKLVGRLCASQDPQVMITYKDMGDLRARVEQAFRDWDYNNRGARFTADVMRFVVDVLRDNCRFVPVIAADVDSDDDRIDELTQQQWKTLEALLSNKRVLVKGVAGSGKTLLAVWAAAKLADDGRKRVLFLCYNDTLADWLRARHPASGVEYIHFHSLCSQLARRAGLPFNVVGNADDFWRNKADGLLIESLEALALTSKPVAYDYVFVDEAQDFQPQWWIATQMLLKDSDHGGLYLFADPAQIFYTENCSSFPPTAVDVELRENCRNTKKIAAYCRNVASNGMESFAFSPEGVQPEVLNACPNIHDRAATVTRICSNLLREGFSPGRIAILSPWTRNNTASILQRIQRVDDVKCVTPDTDGGLKEWMDGKGILATTIKSFKGLEADCVIISDVPDVGTTGFREADLYVASSRAKHRLAFLPVSTQARNQLLGWRA